MIFGSLDIPFKFQLIPQQLYRVLGLRYFSFAKQLLCDTDV